MGAVPSAYLVGRYLRGIDIRRFGSGNVGASNAIEAMGLWPGLALGAFDCVVKGTLPVVLARASDQGAWVQAMVGVLAVAGHNWSPYIGFTGGRGVATTIGVLLGLSMWRELLVMAVLLGLIGRVLMRDTAFWTLTSMLALPPLTYLFAEPRSLTYTSVAIVLVVLAKRTTANWEPRPDERPWHQVMVSRIVWDRDDTVRERWTKRPQT